MSRTTPLDRPHNRNVRLNLRDVFPHPYTAADVEGDLAWVTGQDPVTTAAVAVDGEAVGSIGLVPGSDIARRSAEIGYWLGEAHGGHGIATAAVRAATAYAFRELDLLRVFGLPFTHNPASARVLERAGYVLEGTVRRSAVEDGRVLDQHLDAAVRD